MQQQQRTVRVQEAMAVLLEEGFTLSHSRHLLYRLKSGEYELLAFTEKADLLENKTESFEDINDAISKYIRRVGPDKIGE
jgi:hypothetical protein